MSFLRRKGAASAALAASCLWMSLAMAQTPDNTANNKGDTQTAEKQSNAKADREITAKVRKEIVSDKDLSTYAHNVKVITVNGVVTLKGPVKSEDEKAKVSELAANVVSADKITNELTVK
jgi:hyperosmotically inducible periplasmic protein